MKQRKIEDPFDPSFPGWWACDVADMKRMFGSSFHTVGNIPESAPAPWYLFGRPFWRLCEVRKWVRDMGGLQAAREAR